MLLETLRNEIIEARGQTWAKQLAKEFGISSDMVRKIFNGSKFDNHGIIDKAIEWVEEYKEKQEARRKRIEKLINQKAS